MLVSQTAQGAAYHIHGLNEDAGKSISIYFSKKYKEYMKGQSRFLHGRQLTKATQTEWHALGTAAKAEAGKAL